MTRFRVENGAGKVRPGFGNYDSYAHNGKNEQKSVPYFKRNVPISTLHHACMMPTVHRAAAAPGDGVSL
jgi:hypothetical protein